MNKKSFIVILSLFLTTILTTLFLLISIPADWNPLCSYRDKIIRDLKHRYNQDFIYEKTIYDTDRELKIKVSSKDDPSVVCTALFSKTAFETTDNFIANCTGRNAAKMWSSLLPYDTIINVEFTKNYDVIKNTTFKNTDTNTLFKISPKEFAQKYADTTDITVIVPYYYQNNIIPAVTIGLKKLSDGYTDDISIHAYAVTNFPTYFNNTNDEEYITQHAMLSEYIFITKGNVLQNNITRKEKAPE